MLQSGVVSEGWRDVATQNKNVYVLMMAQACFLASSMTVVSFSGLAGKLLSPDPKYATLATSLIIAATALSTGPMSMLMQRYSRRVGFRFGSTMGVCGGMLGAYSLYVGSFTLLCIASLLLGVFQASAQYYRFAAAESVPADNAARAISLVLVGGLLAALIVPTLVGWFNEIAAPYSFMGAYLFVIAATLMSFVPLALFKPLDSPLKVAAEVDGPKPSPARPFGQILRTPVFIVAVLNGALGFAMMSFVMTATPLAMDICGFGTDVSFRVIQAHVIAMFLPSLFTGYLIKRFGLVTILLSGHALFAISFFTALSGIQLWQFSVSLLALGVAWNFCFIGGSTLLTQVHTESEKGKVQGVNEFSVFGVSAVASFAAGILLDLYGWATVNQAAFVMLSVAATATILWGVSSQRRKHESLVQ